MSDDNAGLCVDCDAGRRLGCGTFCCRLLVRLRPHETAPGSSWEHAGEYVEKDTDGMCIHMQRDDWQCGIWGERPQVCRQYSCNRDFLLQVAVREEFSDIVELIDKATTADIPEEQYVKVPEKPCP
jgi:hypothetical protein